MFWEWTIKKKWLLINKKQFWWVCSNSNKSLSICLRSRLRISHCLLFPRFFNSSLNRRVDHQILMFVFISRCRSWSSLLSYLNTWLNVINCCWFDFSWNSSLSWLISSWNSRFNHFLHSNMLSFYSHT